MTAAAAAVALLPVLGTAQAADPGQAEPGTLQQAFADAAQRYGVPQSVLLGVSYMESRWDSHQGMPSVSAGYGPMHLTDARTALTDYPQEGAGDGGDDARGDDSRPVITTETAQAPDVAALPAGLTTLDRAASLTGLPADALRQDAAANIAGGAALLADTQTQLGEPLSADPADWYAAVARYSGAEEQSAATGFADEVFATVRQGQTRTTDTGQQVVLAAAPDLAPAAGQAERVGLKAVDSAGTECPQGVSCEWVRAPYEDLGGGDYGNHDLGDRPDDEHVDAIIIHDTEATWATTLKLVQDPTYVSWHYSVRSTDGLIAQHVPTKDVAWHAGNWYVNSHSIGIEHEGFLVAPGAWYTEAMYHASAKLVRYLADRYDVPLDRQHILGHDNVPGPTASYIKGMHTDPGPYWDWRHYLALMGAPVVPDAGPWGGAVTIRPDYETNQPLYTGCYKAGDTCPAHGSDAVRLYTAPSTTAPLVKDVGLHGTGPSTTGVNDVGARASTGQQFAVAERRGDWTAIWYLGQKAWFHNPAAAPTAVNTQAMVITPKPGLAAVPTYGRAYPEASAYPAGVPVQGVYAMPYQVLAGQKYVVGNTVHGEYYYAVTYDPASHKVVRGQQLYYEIQLGHRVEWVKADDVVLEASGTPQP